MSERELSEGLIIPTDPSLNFDFFELVRERLSEFLVVKGYSTLDAAKVGLFIAEGTRHVPRLLKALTKAGGSTDEEIQEALGAVLDSYASLGRAKRVLLRRDEPDSAEPERQTRKPEDSLE